jgi:DNA-binding protein
LYVLKASSGNFITAIVTCERSSTFKVKMEARRREINNSVSSYLCWCPEKDFSAAYFQTSKQS